MGSIQEVCHIDPDQENRYSPSDMSECQDQRSKEEGEESVAIVTKRSSQGSYHSARAKKVTTTHKVRALRELVASMEKEVQRLESKWTIQVPDDRVLAMARRCAMEKYAANQSEMMQAQLQELLFQQQFRFASLQTALLRAPLHSNASEVFHALHFDTQLSQHEDEREKGLVAHNLRSLSTLPSLVDQTTQRILQTTTTGGNPVMSRTPVSQIDIAGCSDCTLISGIFVSEIPRTSLEVVYAAVLAYFDSVATAMKSHFDIETRHQKLNSIESPVHYQQSSFKGPKVSWTENNIVCSELTPSHGMVHIDAVTDDPLYPVSNTASSRYGICCLTLSPRKDLVTGEMLSVTLRWVVAYRYNRLADDPEIEKEVETIRPILNGDLITASVCRFLREVQQGRRQILHRQNWTLDIQ